VQMLVNLLEILFYLHKFYKLRRRTYAFLHVLPCLLNSIYPEVPSHCKKNIGSRNGLETMWESN
jgi:hypothetical protein